jgi:hypothetical protein
LIAFVASGIIVVADKNAKDNVVFVEFSPVSHH